MGFLNIFVGSKVYANIEKNQLKLTKIDNSDNITYPLVDINSVMFDDSFSTITLKTLNKLSENNIITYFCDEKHLPQSYLLSYNSFYKNLEVYNKQIEVKKPTLKNIWKNIIRSKISNQIEVLNILNIENELDIYLDKILSDDSSNIEGVVAGKYFRLLFGTNFNRRLDSCINSALNYGYAIIRGSIARSVVSHGLQPFIGIHHINKLNNFNLVDDLIEPFRAIVDLYISSNLDYFNEQLNHEKKMFLLNLLNLDILWKGQKISVSYAIDNLVESYVNCITNNEPNIFLPQILPPRMHEYE